MTYSEMEKFIGRKCIITIAKEPELVEFRGTLMSASADGDADIMLPTGHFLIVWPVLALREDD